MRILFALTLISSVFTMTPAHSQKLDDPNSSQLSSNLLVDSIATIVERNYVLPEKATAIASMLRHRSLRSKYKTVRSPVELAAQIERDIQAFHKDPHLRLSYDPEFATQLLQPRPDIPRVDTAAIKSDRLANFGFRKVEILNGNIGYLEFTSFNGNIDAARETITAAFRFLSHSSEIIIDLRRNGGGSPEGVQYIASYFFDKKTRLNDIYNRRRNDTTQYWADPEVAGNMKLGMPVYLLTSRRTFSAAEDFCYAMQVNGRAILIGDTTRGGAHPTISLPAGQGFVFDVPFARSINYVTKTDWEGKGVRPDIIASDETALKTAVYEILNTRKMQARSDEDKHRAQWLLDASSTLDCDCAPDPALRQSYVGQYGRFSIHLRGDQLFLKDFTGRTFLLRPISADHFLADDWLQIRFVEQEGKIVKMKMLGKPGWVDVYDKL